MAFIRLSLPFIKSRAVAGVGDLVDPDSIRTAFNIIADWGRRLGSQLNELSATVDDAHPDRTVTVADDHAAYVETPFDTQRATIVVSPNVAAGGAAVVHARVGTSGAATVVASAGSVTAAAGALDGTTGVDGDLTISVTTTSPFRIYLENRTGATRAYTVAFVAVQGSRTVKNRFGTFVQV